jgi:hypothetical protein
LEERRVLGLADGIAEDIQNVPEATGDRLALSDEVESGDDVGVIKALGQGDRPTEASLLGECGYVNEDAVGEGLLARIGEDDLGRGIRKSWH